jgi:AraC-like DNA-binding protein
MPPRTPPSKDYQRYPWIRETHIIGADTREMVVMGNTQKPLAVRNFQVLGLSEAAPGFEFATKGWRYGQILVCTHGKGLVQLGPDFTELTPSHAYLTPFGKPHAYRAIPGVPWHLAWVTYEHPGERTPLTHLDAATVVSCDPAPLHSAIRGLYQEVVGLSDAAYIEAWAEIVHLAAWRIAAGSESAVRLGRAWEAVDADPAYPWDLGELAKLVDISPEHLRRLCHRHLGRTPMEHVTRLRMRRAATLLTSTQMKVDAVAESVGYADRFGFSVAFKRHLGVTPAEYRRLALKRD